MKKKFVMMLLSAMMVTGSMSIAHAAELDKDFADMTIETEGVEPRKVDTSGSFSLSAGQSFKKSFKVGNLIGADHDAFNVKVKINSGATADLIVTITSDDGYYYSENITSDTTITVKNCDPDEKYTVEFSTEAYDATEHIGGKYYITSYIK